MVGPALQMTETPLALQGASPTLGEHNDDVLSSIGYSAEEIEAMRASGAIR
jgi:formyl-CoA transferase